MHSPGFGRSRLSPSTRGAGPSPASCPRFMELTVALPHPVAESDHLSPKPLQFPLIFYRPRISKANAHARYAIQPLPIRLKTIVDGCPVQASPPPCPRQPWTPGHVFPTPHPTAPDQRPLSQAACWAIDVTGWEPPRVLLPRGPRLDTAAAPIPEESRPYCMNQKWTLLPTWGRGSRAGAPPTALTELSPPLRTPASQPAFLQLRRRERSLCRVHPPGAGLFPSTVCC